MDKFNRNQSIYQFKNDFQLFISIHYYFYLLFIQQLEYFRDSASSKQRTHLSIFPPPYKDNCLLMVFSIRNNWLIIIYLQATAIARNIMYINCSNIICDLYTYNLVLFLIFQFVICHLCCCFVNIQFVCTLRSLISLTK